MVARLAEKLARFWAWKGAPILVIGCSSLVAAVIGAIYLIPSPDALCRYAPMCEAFAAGEWSEAFHPRFGVGFPALCGIVRAVTGLDGLATCSCVAMFLWALAAYPFYVIVRRLFGSTAAFFALVIYFLAPQPIIWSLRGMRESARMLGTLLMVAGILARYQKDSGLVSAILGGLVLCTFRNDTILVAGAFALAYAVVDRFRLRTWGLFAALLAIVQLPCALVWSKLGYWLPAAQYIRVWQSLFGV